MANDNYSLRQAIENQARRLGFLLLGVTKPVKPSHYDIYEAWVEAGLHGEMAYLARDDSRAKRADPRLILPECRSILMLGAPYPAFQMDEDEKVRRQGHLLGKIAAYACGVDYHAVLGNRLSSLVDFIHSILDTPTPARWYVDTGPVLERDLASQAGLGWIGKNGCLINPGLGSYFFISEILLGIDLSPTPPFPYERCGTCSRCLEACPTGCILPNRTIDSRRCIAYLTIELKGPIPQELRPFLRDWVFGCDVCQQVCPWNQRFAHFQGDSVISPRPGLPFVDLLQSLRLSSEQFNFLYKGTPIQRAKRSSFLRNIAVVLGNLSDPRAELVLQETLFDDPEPLVRGHVAWALGQIGSPASKKALKRAARSENAPFVLKEIHQALNL